MAKQASKRGELGSQGLTKTRIAELNEVTGWRMGNGKWRLCMGRDQLGPWPAQHMNATKAWQVECLLVGITQVARYVSR